jgi:ATP-binding cassette, subfamily B, bacterial
LQVLQMTPEDPKAGRPAPMFRGEITFDRVRYAYPDGPQALNDVSFVVPAGALVALVGPNGAGKSTILGILLRLVEPNAGEVRIDGEAIAEFRIAAYRSRFAYVPQPVQLFSGTLRENILFGRLDATQGQIEEAARKTLLDDVVDRLPGGFDARLGEGGETLSGGEARRLMLARAAVRDARVLLLDEPLTGLDPSAREMVARALRQIAAGRTTIVVSHDAVADLDPDVTIRLDAGRLVETMERPFSLVNSSEGVEQARKRSAAG